MYPEDPARVPQAGTDGVDPLRASVVVLCRNCREPLRRCLDSLERLPERAGIEVIVVDKGSSDGSQTLDSDFPSVNLLRLPKNFGNAKALNIAARTARTEFLLLLPADAEVPAGGVSSLIEILERRQDAIAVCPAAVSPNGEALPLFHPLPGPGDLWQWWMSNSGVPPALPQSDVHEESAIPYPEGAPMLIRRQFIRGMNFIDERYGEFGPALEIAWQIQRAGKLILLAPGVRFTLHADCADAAKNALEAADRASGIASYLAKHYGWGASFSFRLRAIFRTAGRALAAMLRARDIGYHFSLLAALVSGKKVDGTQAGA